MPSLIARMGDVRRVVIDTIARGGSTVLITCSRLDEEGPATLLLVSARDFAAMRTRPQVAQVRLIQCVREGRWSLVDGMELR